MSYHSCRHGDPCADCNGYVGPLDTYACLCSCHQRCSQEPHPGVEFYGQGGCAECGYRPDAAR